jgi:hypothetical protein
LSLLDVLFKNGEERKREREREKGFSGAMTSYGTLTSMTILSAILLSTALELSSHFLLSDRLSDRSCASIIPLDDFYLLLGAISQRNATRYVRREIACPIAGARNRGRRRERQELCLNL